MIERFSPQSDRHMELTVTYDDGTMWTRSWSWAIRLTKDNRQHIFEYACHEGNRSLPNILSRARRADRGEPSVGGSVDPVQQK
jgi:hypothetical protein